MLAEKSSELGSSASKLANGLAKLEDAKEQVETLSKELEVKKVIVAQSELKNEEFLWNKLITINIRSKRLRGSFSADC